MKKQDLYQKIMQFEIDSDQNALPFAKRLARENAWSDAFAEEVIIEYKRFIYLTVVCDKEVTPSDEIDQVWHLHLTYTRSYWSALCKGILGHELHHLPTKGGKQEQARFKQQYAETLEAYQQEFQTNAPEKIWPPVKARFLNADGFVRINKHKVFIFNKPGKWLRNSFLLLFIPLFIAACVHESGDGDLFFWLKMGIGIIGGLYILKKLNDWLGGGKGGGGSGCGAACGGCSGCGG